jgi:hypothetical protein
MTEPESPLQRAMDAYPAMVKPALQAIHEAYRDDFKESVQTVVWIVSLATGMLVLIASSPTALDIGEDSRRWLAGSLLLTVVAGVAQRVAQRTASLKMRHVVTVAEMAIVTADSAIDVEPLMPTWTCKEITSRAKTAFGEEEQESFLKIEEIDEVSLARSLYETLRLGRRNDYVVAILGAAEGEGAVSTTDPKKTSVLEDVVLVGRSFDRWLNAANGFYYAACGLFTIALGIVGFQLIR